MKTRIKFNNRKFDLALARSKLSVSELASSAGVGRNSIYNVRDKGVLPIIAGKIAEALGVDVADITV